MIPENCIVPGKDIKGLPLNAVCFEEDLELVEEFISNETSWELINDLFSLSKEEIKNEKKS